MNRNVSFSECFHWTLRGVFLVQILLSGFILASGNRDIGIKTLKFALSLGVVTLVLPFFYPLTPPKPKNN